ncbi:MAG: succinylglutamate desuccinylase/aspartoacylase family protein [Planctomycetes bacterium]|nr:succinylglutamate desuccinylase/aspartoacylase family protein [Planctomycetota bacterium]
MNDPCLDEAGADTWHGRRVIADLRGARPGPLLICIGGVHGNEPSGGLALLRLIDEIETRIPLQRGRLLALTGNMKALARGQRYIDEDLNRAFTDRRIERLRADALAACTSEEREMLALVTIIGKAVAGAESAYLLDLHSTSGPGLPFGFALNADNDPALISAFAIPLLMGVERQLQGTILDWFARQGHSAIGVEGGQHDDPATVDAHEAVLRITLDALGLRGFDVDPRLEEAQDLLEERAAGLPRFLEFSHRFEVKPDTGFAMKPGFSNFDYVRKGQVLASDHGGDILAEEDAWLLFPRYQAQGDDGFFLARSI